MALKSLLSAPFCRSFVEEGDATDERFYYAAPEFAQLSPEPT